MHSKTKVGRRFKITLFLEEKTSRCLFEKSWLLTAMISWTMKAFLCACLVAAMKGIQSLFLNGFLDEM